MFIVTTVLAVAACLLVGSVCWARGHTAGYREGRSTGYSTGYRRGHLRGQGDAYTSAERLAGRGALDDMRGHDSPGYPWADVP